MNYTAEFASGNRVQVHPATDAWMRGDRYGYVQRISKKYVWVRMDSQRVLRFRPEDLERIA